MRSIRLHLKRDGQLEADSYLFQKTWGGWHLFYRHDDKFLPLLNGNGHAVLFSNKSVTDFQTAIVYGGLPAGNIVFDILEAMEGTIYPLYPSRP